jgi:TonB family protein
VSNDLIKQTPHVVGWGTSSPRDYYPAEAERQRILGKVVLTVTLDPEGQPTEAQVRSEEPADQGFGAAALNLSRKLVYSNPTGQPAQLTFMVTFAPNHNQPHGT